MSENFAKWRNSMRKSKQNINNDRSKMCKMLRNTKGKVEYKNFNF